MAQMNGELRPPARRGSGLAGGPRSGPGYARSIEGALRLTPEQRLAEHQQVINFLLEVQAAGEAHAAK